MLRHPAGKGLGLISCLSPCNPGSEPDTTAKPGALFFLPEDPAEENNLAYAYPEKAKELSSLLSGLLKDAGAAESCEDGLGGAVDK